MPDYSNQISIGKKSSYTAEKTGWIVAHYYGYSTSGTYTAQIKINNKIVFSDTTEAPSPNQARASRGQIMLPIDVGDVVTGLSATDTNCYFIPGKWVTPTN